MCGAASRVRTRCRTCMRGVCRPLRDAWSEPVMTPEHGRGFQIFIKTLPGLTITLDVQSECTPRQLADRIQNKEGVLPGIDQFVFAGRPLDPDVSLVASGVRKESTLHMVHRMRRHDACPVCYRTGWNAAAVTLLQGDLAAFEAAAAASWQLSAGWLRRRAAVVAVWA
jgi:hypothetical protein